jgi:DNA-binding MarR family transcriptional regulator
MNAPSPFVVPPEAVLEVCLCHATRRAARALSRAYDAALAPFGLTSGQFSLLTAIAAATPASVNRLGEIMCMDASTLSRNLKPLRSTGLITMAGASGRRPGQIQLTDSGARALSDALPAWQSVQARLTQGIGTGAAGALLQGLDRAARTTPT